MFLLGVPLLIIPFALYNILAFLIAGFSWTTEHWRLRMTSGAEWGLSAGDLLIAGSVFIMLIEMLKSSRMMRRSVVDHVLSMILFAGMAVEFVMVPQAASSTFFLLLTISFVDVAGGFAISVHAAHHEVVVNEVENIHTTH
jgi:hypothetical protein